MMNFPGVLGGDPECLAKIRAAQQRGKPVDGHAPGLRGAEAARYVAAGMTTDHECFTKEEALDKIAAGCKISIREGSAARNFDALYTLLGEHPGNVRCCAATTSIPTSCSRGTSTRWCGGPSSAASMCSTRCRRRASTRWSTTGWTWDCLRVGDPADFIEVDSLTAFNVRRTWIDGRLVAENGATLIPRVELRRCANKFVATHVQPDDFAVPVAKRAEAASDRGARRPAHHASRS